MSATAVTGRLRPDAGSLDGAASPVAALAAVRGAVDQAYRDKYGRYGDTYVVPMVGDDAAAATFRVTPAPAAGHG